MGVQGVFADALTPYASSHGIERLFNRLEQHRRIATRGEQRASNDQAMLTLTALLLWL